MEDYLDEDVLDIQPEIAPQESIIPQEEENIMPEGPLDGDYNDEPVYVDEDSMETIDTDTSPLAGTADAKRATMGQKSEEKRARLSSKFQQPEEDPLLQSTEDFERGIMGDTATQEVIDAADPTNAMIAEQEAAQGMVDERAQEEAVDQTQYDENIVGYGVDKLGEGALDLAENVVGKNIANDVRGFGSMTADIAGWVAKAPRAAADILEVDKENFAYDVLDYLHEGGEAMSKIDFGFDSSGLEREGKYAKENFLAAIKNGEGYGQATLDAVNTISLQSVVEGISQAVPYGKALGAKIAISAPVFVGSVLDMSTEDLKARQMNKPGEKISATEKASIVAINTALMFIEKLAFDKVLGRDAKRALLNTVGKNMTTAEKAALKAKIDAKEALVDPGKLGFGMKEKATTFGRGVAAGTTEETIQETLQAVGSTYNQKYDTKAMDGASLSDEDLANITYQGAFGGLTGTGMSATIGQYHEQKKTSYDRRGKHMEDSYVFSQRRDKDLVEKNAPDLTRNFNDTEANYELSPEILQNHDIVELPNGQEAIEIEVLGSDANGKPEKQKIVYPVQKIGDKYTINNTDMQEAYPDASKEEIVNQLAPIVKNTDKIENADSVVIDGQRWKKNPDYDPAFPKGYMQDGEFHSNEEWVQTSGFKDSVEQELNFDKDANPEESKQALEKNRDIEIEQSTKTEEAKITKTQKVVDMLDKGLETAKSKFETAKAKVEKRLEPFDAKIKEVEKARESLKDEIDRQKERIKIREGRQLSPTQQTALDNAKAKVARTEAKLEKSDKKIADLQDRKTNARVTADRRIDALQKTMDTRVDKINTAKETKLESIKGYEKTRDDVTSKITSKYDTAFKKLESRGTVNGKPSKQAKRKYRDNLKDIMLKASEKATGPLTDKRKANIEKIVDKLLKESSDTKIKDAYIKAFKKVHGEAAAQREADAASEAANERTAKHKTKKTETRKQSKPEPENFQKTVKEMQTISNEELPDIIEELAKELDEIQKDC